MKNNFETKNLDISLGKMPPSIESITNLDPNDVSIDHLSSLDKHLKSLKEKFPDIAKEIKSTRKKIELAISLGNNYQFISSEIMRSANDLDYNSNREYRKAA